MVLTSLNNLHFYFLQAAHHAAEATGHAAGAEHGEGAHHAEPTMMEFILESNLINFLIAVAVIVWIIKKLNVGQSIDNAHQKMVAEIKELEEERKKAEAELAEIKDKTKNISAEVDTILKNAKESADKMSATIIEDSKEQAAKIVDNAKKRVALEQKSAAADLQKRLLNDAMMDAREDMVNDLSSDDQKKSVEDFIEALSASK